MNNGSIPKSAAVVGAGLLVYMAFSLMWLAVSGLPPHLIDQCDHERNAVESAPIVVVGVLASDTLISRPVPMHSDPKYPLQLRKLTMRVENVLKGAPIPATIAVYYFTWAGGFDGPRPLGFWTVGGRRILWLRRDSGVLRTACDGSDGCTETVWSGAHPHFMPDSQKPFEYALVDLHLTRGEGIVNESGFATEVFREEPDQIPGLQAYAVQKQRHLALTEHGDVKSSACMALWIYTVDRVQPTIKLDAENAMHAANCRCNKKPDGNVECQ